MAKKSRRVTIYGAGMSGLIAAINLRRDGFEVTVREKEPTYGGSRIYNPSTHVTPLDLEATSKYIGIDISSVFHQVSACPSYFDKTKVLLPVYEVYAVERGNRETSLDTLLFNECKRMGVDFEFDFPLTPKELENLPPHSIIACGLTPSAYEMLGIPYLRWFGWISRGEIRLNSYAWLWWGKCVTEYGYFSSVNNYYFDLLFSTKPVPKSCLDEYVSFIAHVEGIEHRDWRYISGAVPIASSENPRLFWKNAILCGTISGAQDPFMWFGISGALITGKIAALALTDREKAEREFKRFTRLFSQALWFKNKIWYRFIRPNIHQVERGIRLVGPARIEKLARLSETGKIPARMAIPGFSHLSCH